MKLISVVLSSVLALAALEARAQEQAPATVTVAGEASEEAQPDVAWLSLTIRVQKPTAAEASSENARRAIGAIAALTAAGVEARDIATVGLAIDPVWSGQNSPRSVVAFEATNRLSVRVRAIDRAGPILAQAVTAGAEYDGVSFDLSDRDAREDALRGKAVENAAHRAALYAGGAAMKLGALQSIHADPSESGFRPMFAKTAALASAPPPPIEPGPITLSESVTGTWTLIAQ
jgi:uncharacterized protein YggE